MRERRRGRRHHVGPLLAACAALLAQSRLGAEEPPVEPAPQVEPEPARAPLSGVLLGRGDRVPLAGVTVVLDSGETAITDEAGAFSFPAVPAGERVARLGGASVGAVEVRFALSAGKRTLVTWYVLRLERRGSTVRGRRVVQETVEQSLSAEEVKHIPGTQGDAVKAVQNLPGVARPPFNGGLIVVWGSAPEDTRAYVDGVFVPTLFHFSGLRSTVNSELLQSLTFMPGGYGVEYGRGLGGAIEVESRRPRSDGYHGYAQVDLIDVSAMVEGPIRKDLEFAAAGRVSWLNLFLPFFVTGDVQASPRYWDYQAKLHYRPSPRDDLELFFFGSDDRLELILKDPDPTLALQVEHHTFYHRGLLRFVHRFAGGATIAVTPSFGYDLPDNRSFITGALPFSITDDRFEWSLRAVARIPLAPLLRLDAGVDYEGTRFTYDGTQNAGGMLRDGDSGGFAGLSGPDYTRGVKTEHFRLITNEVAPFAALVFSLLGKRLTVTPQLRAELLSFVANPGTPGEVRSGAVLFEPRIAVRVQVHPRVALKASVGWYHQPPLPLDLSPASGNPALQAESAVHYVLGLEVRITPTLKLEAQGFYKDLRNLVVRSTSSSGPGLAGGGEGRVWGGELLLRQELWKGFFGWLSYTVSRSERRDHPFAGAPPRLFQYDQTHLLTVIGSYKLPRGFQVGLRFRYATGNPYTPVAGAYFDASSDSYMPLFGATYSARLPAFNQLDLRVDKELVFDRWRLIVYLDLENVYAASGAETVTYNYSFTQSAFVSGLPFLPVLGIRGEL